MVVTIGGVTYVTPRQAAQETGVAEGTIRNWEAAGAVDSVTRRGRMFVRLGAVRYMRNTDAKVTRTEGVRRVSPAAAAAKRAWFLRKQELTQAEATRAFEIWEATEEGIAVEVLTATDDITTRALRLGRSYAAVGARRYRERVAAATS